MGRADNTKSYTDTYFCTLQRYKFIFEYLKTMRKISPVR